MYDRILVPTDGSDAIQPAIDEAIAVAELTDGTIHALSVVDVEDLAIVPDTEVMAVEESLEAAAERAVGEVRSRAQAAGLAVRTTVRHGTPHAEILDYADEQNIDLIVMGKRGRSDIDRVLLGSVTESVVRNADVPVLIKRLDEER